MNINKIKEETNISVHLRIKPTAYATNIPEKSGIKIKDQKITIYNNEYNVDNIFINNSQSELYKFIIQKQIEKTFQGYNCTIMAYGQTGSGKTYTIKGEETNYGIILRVLCQLFELIDKKVFNLKVNGKENGKENQRLISIKISYLEIYNERIKDLLKYEDESSTINNSIINNSSINENKPKIREGMDGTYVSNISVIEINSLEESKRIFKKGNSKRSICSTKMNEKSSRSHTIFTIYLEFKENSIIKKSKINIVDLAGSESLKHIKNNKDNKETGNINRSLFYLSEVIKKLSSNIEQYINYRDSKLTHLLKESLAGNSILLVIGTINLDFIPECLNTLNFLKRTKNIKKFITQNFDLKDKNNKFYYEELKSLSNQNHLLLLENSKLKNIKNIKKYGDDELIKIIEYIKTLEEKIDLLDNLIKDLFIKKIELKQEDILKEEEWNIDL